MTRRAEAARGPIWIVRVRGTLGVCSERYAAFRPVFDGECTSLEMPADAGRSLMNLLLDLQSFGIEVVDIDWTGT